MKYKHIVGYITKAIENGEYKKGMRIPSIRKMAADHHVNKATIIKAYEELEDKYIIYSVAKSGYYVTGDIAGKNVRDETIDFSCLAPDEKLLPFREFNHCVNRAVSIYKQELFTYGDAKGLYSLRKALADYFYTKDIYTKDKNICITGGAHQALSILINMHFPNDKQKILIEQPTYSEIYNMIDTFNIEYRIVNRYVNGLDLLEVERIFKSQDIKFFYTMSKFHNPLGSNLSTSQKLELLELANKYDVYIVEDDYFGDLETIGTNLPIHYYDTKQKVIYLRSFSKNFMPGIRLGCAVLGDKLINEFVKVKRSYDLNTSILMQGALELYITNGMYDAHIRKINSAYKKKYNVFLEQLNALDKEHKYITPTGNSQVFWINLSGINSTDLKDKLLKRGVRLSDGRQYLLHDSQLNGIRLCIAPMSNKAIRQGIHIIYEVLLQKI